MIILLNQTFYFDIENLSFRFEMIILEIQKETSFPV